MRALTALIASFNALVSVTRVLASSCDCSWSIRMSAIICRVSLSAADADEGSAVTATASATAGKKCFMGSLRCDDEMRAAILDVRALVVARIEWKFLAVAHGAQPVGRNAERHEVSAGGHGS